MKPKIIAYYLPQFHPFKENDEWWGKGFTEWTNVGKAKPLFRGHYQPRVPADLGYYDLRLPVVREEQVQLAKEAGVYGFCYWHYWFGGKGRQLLNEIIDDVVKTGKPDFPFCIGWANESWKAKQWNKDGKGDRFLMEQRYEGDDDYKEHFKYALTLFRDESYILVDNKPLVLIYQPQMLPDAEHFIFLWNQLAKENGFDGVYFVARIQPHLCKNMQEWLDKGFCAVTTERITSAEIQMWKPLRNIKRYLRSLLRQPLVLDYGKAITAFVDVAIDKQEKFIPCIIPNWDHSPRSGRKAKILKNSTPLLFRKHVKDVLNIVKHKDNQLVFLKSWNEWAEGNYMEPDLKYGKGYIETLGEEIANI